MPETSASLSSCTGCIPEFVHWLHVYATAWWAGSVVLAMPVLRAIAAAPRDGESRHLAFAEHLSFSATIALACVIATGIYNAAHIVTRTSAPLMHTAYGRLLVIKIALVAFAAMLGALNRVVRLPQLRDARALTIASPMERRGDRVYCDTARAFDRTIALEALTLLLVLVIAAVLAHTSPFEG